MNLVKRRKTKLWDLGAQLHFPKVKIKMEDWWVIDSETQGVPRVVAADEHLTLELVWWQWDLNFPSQPLGKGKRDEEWFEGKVSRLPGIESGLRSPPGWMWI